MSMIPKEESLQIEWNHEWTNTMHEFKDGKYDSILPLFRKANDNGLILDYPEDFIPVGDDLIWYGAPTWFVNFLMKLYLHSGYYTQDDKFIPVELTEAEKKLILVYYVMDNVRMTNVLGRYSSDEYVLKCVRDCSERFSNQFEDHKEDFLSIPVMFDLVNGDYYSVAKSLCRN